MTGEEARWAGLGPEDCEPTAAPTPVEPEPKWLTVPNEQAWWWHFNGGNYTVPHIFSVMVSNTGTPRYFVQYPDSRWCDEIGGWWLKVEYPNVPTREYMRSSAPAESQGQPAPTQIAAKRYYDRQKEQIAAESQGVERAQPECAHAPEKENHMEGLLMKYFVLKPAGNDRYAAASRRAMRAYADFIREENVVLSDQLRDWAGREGAEAYAAGVETNEG